VAASMGVVRVPLTGPATPERAAELRERLLDRRADAPLHARKSTAPRAYQRQTKQADPLIACAYLAGTNTRRVVALAPEPDSPAEQRDAEPGSRACLDLREREEFPDLEEERFLIIFVGLPPSQLALLSTIIASPRVWPKTVTEVPWLVQTLS
jgi:hypothetical protein